MVLKELMGIAKRVQNIVRAVMEVWVFCIYMTEDCFFGSKYFFESMIFTTF